MVCLRCAQVRVPFTAFRPTEVGMPPLDPSNVSSLALRFEQRRPVSTPCPCSLLQSLLQLRPLYQVTGALL